jgi:hypothetical protein
MSEQNLESLCIINPETLDQSTSVDFEFRYIDISAVKERRIDWSATRIFRFADAPSRARRRLRVGDALLCTVRPMLKAHARVEKADSIALVASTGFAVLRSHLETDAASFFINCSAIRSRPSFEHEKRARTILRLTRAISSICDFMPRIQMKEAGSERY